MSCCIHHKMLTLVNVSPPAVEFYRMVVLVDLHVSSGEGDTHLKHFRAWWINCLFSQWRVDLDCAHSTQHTAWSLLKLYMCLKITLLLIFATSAWFTTVRSGNIKQAQMKGSSESPTALPTRSRWTINEECRPLEQNIVTHKSRGCLVGGIPLKWTTTNYFCIPCQRYPVSKNWAEVNTKRKHRLLGKLLRFHCFRQFSVLLQYSK